MCSSRGSEIKGEFYRNNISIEVIGLASRGRVSIISTAVHVAVFHVTLFFFLFSFHVFFFTFT